MMGCDRPWLLPSRADLVPTYSFGENEVYKQVIFEEGSWGRWVQKKFQKYIGFAPCIFHGRGLFSSDTWGLVPYSKPITTVGEPPWLHTLNSGYSLVVELGLKYKPPSSDVHALNLEDMLGAATWE